MKHEKVTACVARVAAREGVLLGGVKVHVSAPFREWRDAVRWCDTVIDANIEAGREPIYDGISLVEVFPQYAIPAADW